MNFEEVLKPPQVLDAGAIAESSAGIQWPSSSEATPHARSGAKSRVSTCPGKGSTQMRQGVARRRGWTP